MSNLRGSEAGRFGCFLEASLLREVSRIARRKSRRWKPKTIRTAWWRRLRRQDDHLDSRYQNVSWSTVQTPYKRSLRHTVDRPNPRHRGIATARFTYKTLYLQSNYLSNIKVDIADLGSNNRPSCRPRSLRIIYSTYLFEKYYEPVQNAKVNPE